MYIKKTYRFKDVVEVEEGHNGRYGAPGEHRHKRRKATPEDIARINQWNREKKCRHRLLEYFNAGDAYTTLTYAIDKRPEDMATCKRHFKKFIVKLKAVYKKAGIELRWIRNIEVGTRGGWHIHMIVPDIPGINGILQRLWTHGKAVTQGLYRGDGFRKLAAYITKTPATDSRLRESNYSTSRNMPLKAPRKQVMHRRTWQRPRIRPGWELIPGSFREGINPITGYPYRHYAIMRC